MKKLSTAFALLVLAGCITTGPMVIDMSAPIKAGETCDLAEMTTSRPDGFSMTMTNRGGGEARLEIRNGEQVLGVLAPKETATYSIQGASLHLRVRSLGGDSWLEGRIVAASQ